MRSSCAAALAVLDVIERERLMEKVTLNSVPWIASLAQLAKDFPSQVLAVRGRGYMVGIQLTSDPASMVGALRDAGLLVPSAGGNVIRLLPPLTAAPEELSQSVEIIRAVLTTKA